MKIYNVIDNMNGICKNIFRLYILKSYIIIVWFNFDQVSRANKVDDLTLLFIGAISNKIEYWFLKFERNWKYNWNINKIE